MSLFQAGAYQSKVLSYVVRQTHHWREQGEAVLRKLKVAATWGTQILLYPAYVSFQAIRIAAVQGQQIWNLGVPVFRQALRSQTSLPPPLSAIDSTAETPLRLALEAIREFELPTRLPVISLPKAEKLADNRPLTAPPKSLVIRAISAIEHWWTGGNGWNQRSDQIESDQIESAAANQPQPVCLQGIACCLVTRSLLLVTSQNEILDILTPAQQRQLRDRIIGGVADYYYCLKSEPRMQLLARSRVLIRASQLLWAATRSRLQFLVSFLSALFHASRQVAAQLQSVPLPIAIPQIATAEAKNLALPWTADLPVQQVFRLVQQFSLPGSDRSQIRGIASQLDTRSLVLVTDQNQILDVLTAEQQLVLRHRITWEAAHYGRYCQIRQSTRQALARLHSGGSDRVFPAVRWLRGVMAWMQTSRVAIAANLFQEASLTLAPIVAPSFAPLATPGNLAMELAGTGDRSTVPFLGSAAWISRITSSVSVARGAVEVAAQGTTTHSPDYIETPATPLGYVETPIEALLRGIDRVLMWLEKMMLLAWRWLRQQL